MPVTVSYPGLYIEELLLSSHTIQPAPTSIAAFVGYTHPYQTKQPGQAVRLFGFTDYEKLFGGLYTSGLVDSNVARAVYQFFLNGGSDCYVVGIPPLLRQADGSVIQAMSDDAVRFKATIPSTTAGAGLVFTGNEPADLLPMRVTATNIRPPTNNTFDITITYGSRIETYRKLEIGGDPARAPDVVINPVSNLVQVAPMGGGFGTALPATPVTVTFAAALPGGFATTFSPQDFVDVFEADTLARQGRDLQPAAGPRRRRQSRGERRAVVRRAQARLRHPRSAADCNRRRSRLDRQR